MKNFLILLLFLTFGVSSLQAQTLKQYKKSAAKAYKKGNHYAALHFYKIALELDSQNVKLQYIYADIAREYAAYSLSERYFKKVLVHKKGDKYPLANYWLANVMKFQGKYTESKVAYKKFVSSGYNQDTTLIGKAKKELTYLDWAIGIVAEKKGDVEIIHLGTEINTSQSEHSPFLVDTSLYFTSYGFENDVNSIARSQPFSIIKKSGNNNVATSIEFANKKFTKKSAHLTFSDDRSTVYYTLCKQKSVIDIKCKIYSGAFDENGILTNSTELPSSINLDGFTTSQPSIGYDTKNEKTFLFFVSDRPMGKGGRDIWMSEVLSDNKYSIPVNLEDINTIDDEISPYFHSGSQTLFFSSNGYKNLGGFDIYKSEKGFDNWKKPEHLGYPINSSYNDIDYFITPGQDKAVFASNRKGAFFLEEEKEACCNDIFEADLIPPFLDFLVTTFDFTSKDELNGVNVRLYRENKIVEEQSHPDDNTYTFSPDREFEYVFIATKPGYYPDTVKISTIGYNDLDPLPVKLFLKKKSVALTAFIFDANNKIPLLESTVTLLDCDGKELAKPQTNFSSNIFKFPLEANSCYKLKVEREGYFSKTITFNTDDSGEPIIKKIYLKPRPVTKLKLDKYLPMPMYFDNDEPGNSTLDTTTLLTYEDTYQKYLSKRDVYSSKYAKGLRGDEKGIAIASISTFFDKDVTDGYKYFNKFTEYLLIFLEQGDDAQLVFKGYASPKASKRYNNALTKRRINCVRNHFMNYKDGVFIKFIQSGKLIIREESYGESNVKGGVSDDNSDKRNSVYSPAASKERRLEIIEIK